MLIFIPFSLITWHASFFLSADKLVYIKIWGEDAMLDYSQWHLHISVGYGVTQFMRAENRHIYNDFQHDGFHNPLTNQAGCKSQLNSGWVLSAYSLSPPTNSWSPREMLPKGSCGTWAKEMRPFTPISFVQYSTLTSLHLIQAPPWMWKQINWKIIWFFHHWKHPKLLQKCY